MNAHLPSALLAIPGELVIAGLQPVRDRLPHGVEYLPGRRSPTAVDERLEDWAKVLGLGEKLTRAVASPLRLRWSPERNRRNPPSDFESPWRYCQTHTRWSERMSWIVLQKGTVK